LTIEVVGKPPMLYVNVLHLHDIDRVRRDLLKDRGALRARLRFPLGPCQTRRKVRCMITIAFVILGVAAMLFVASPDPRPDRARPGRRARRLLVTVMCGVLIAAAETESPIGMDSVLVVALLGFIATGVLARYVEQRGG
jgi:hypothetical protein